MDKIDVMFTGHRPPKLGGWDENNIVAQKVKKWLDEEIRLSMLGPNGAKTFVSGGALGTDQWAAEAVINNMGLYPDIKLILAIPCDNYHATWPKESQERFFRIQKKATDTVIVCPGEYKAYKNIVRDQWMVDRAGYCIAVYDGTKGGTHHTVQMALKKGIQIERLDPRLITLSAGSKIYMMEEDCLGRWKKDEMGTLLENDFSPNYDLKVQFDGTIDANIGLLKIENLKVEKTPRIYYFHYGEVYLKENN